MACEKILIVEDEGILAINLKINLSELGYRVLDISPTGEQAVRLAQTLLPDLIVMDIKLAGEIDGIDAAKQIVKDRNVPILFLSAHSDNATYRRAMEIKPAGFLKKPVEDNMWSFVISEALKTA